MPLQGTGCRTSCSHAGVVEEPALGEGRATGAALNRRTNMVARSCPGRRMVIALTSLLSDKWESCYVPLAHEMSGSGRGAEVVLATNFQIGTGKRVGVHHSHLIYLWPGRKKSFWQSFSPQSAAQCF